MAKIFGLSIVISVVLAAPLIRFYEWIFPSKYGSSLFIAFSNPSDNIYFATFSGFFFSFPLVFGFLSYLKLGDKDTKYLLYVGIASGLVNLIWLLGGSVYVWIAYAFKSFVFGLCGIAAGYVVKRVLNVAKTR